MLNFEKHKDEMLELANDGCIIAIDKRTGKLCKCSGLDCKNCKLYYAEGASEQKTTCETELIKWLYEEHKEPIKISAFAKMCLERLKSSGYNYLARDSDYKIWAYEKSARKSESLGKWLTSLADSAQITGAFDDFDFVKWEDEKPWAIQDILDNCEVAEE